MCAGSEKTTVGSGVGKGKKRKKLWEIQEGYHCSVVGTCLSKSDLQTLGRKKLFSLSSDSSEYEVHSALVGLASVRQPQSRYLQKLLDKKHHQAVTRYRAADSEEKVLRLWDEDFESGRVAGAYWAVMTHPVPGYRLISTIYGRVHMLGHECMTQFQYRKKSIEQLRTRLKLFEEVLSSERQISRETAVVMQEKDKLIMGLRREHDTLQETNTAFSLRIRDFETNRAYRALMEERDRIGDELAASRQECNLLCGNMDVISRERDEMQAELERTRSEASDMKKALMDTRRQIRKIEAELHALKAFRYTGAEMEDQCIVCDDRDTERCPGPDLCGKIVLYVGGMHNLVPRYRNLVEEHGGRFLHHDGGREAARSLLPKLLHTADAVVCPVDCISHDACTCVKKMCKRNDKPFVMMRSAGLSSLARGLAEIVQ